MSIEQEIVHEYDEPQKNTLMRALIFSIVMLAAMAIFCFAIGRPDWFICAILSGLSLAVLFIVGQTAIAFFGEEAEPVRKWCWSVTPLAIIGVGLFSSTQLTPAMFTPDSLANTVTIHDLENGLKPYAGRKVTFTGEYFVLVGGSERGSELALRNGKGGPDITVIFPQGSVDPNVAEGQHLTVTAVIEVSRNDGSLSLVASSSEVVPQPLADASP